MFTAAPGQASGGAAPAFKSAGFFSPNPLTFRPRLVIMKSIPFYRKFALLADLGGKLWLNI